MYLLRTKRLADLLDKIGCPLSVNMPSFRTDSCNISLIKDRYTDGLSPAGKAGL